MIKLYRQFNLFFKLLIAIAVAAFLVYYTHPSFNKMAFLLLLAVVWRTKNDYFWLAFMLVLLDSPGGLFTGGTVYDPYRLPIYNLAPKVSFAIEELYMITLFIKAAVNRRSNAVFQDFTYNRQLRIIMMLLVILAIISFMLGTSVTSLRNLFKNLINLSLFYSLIFVFQKHEDIVNFFKALFPFAFVAILLQIYGMISGQQLIALFRPDVTITQGILTGDLLRPIEMAVVLLACGFGSLLFIGGRHGSFSFPYLLSINIVAFTSIIMTATRSWFLGFTSMYIFFIILNYRRIGSVMFKYSIGILVFVAIFNFVPKIGDQVRNSFTRFNTIMDLAAGDPTAGGTLVRLTERAPRVMEGFWNSTIIFGAGYSDLYFKYTDSHVGFHNILFQAGIIGILIILGFAGVVFIKPLRLAKISISHEYRDALRNLPLLIPAVMIINSATQFWGYEVGGARAILLSAYIAISGFYVSRVKSDLLTLGTSVKFDKTIDVLIKRSEKTNTVFRK